MCSRCPAQIKDQVLDMILTEFDVESAINNLAANNEVVGSSKVLHSGLIPLETNDEVLNPRYE